MDVDDLIYLEQLLKRCSWTRRRFHAVYANKIAGYTCDEIAQTPKMFGLSPYNDTRTRVQSTMKRAITDLRNEHEIEKYWGRV